MIDVREAHAVVELLQAGVINRAEARAALGFIKNEPGKVQPLPSLGRIEGVGYAEAPVGTIVEAAEGTGYTLTKFTKVGSSAWLDSEDGETYENDELSESRRVLYKP